MRKIHEKDTGALKTFWGSLMVPDFSDSEDLGESLHEHVIRCLTSQASPTIRWNLPMRCLKQEQTNSRDKRLPR